MVGEAYVQNRKVVLHFDKTYLISEGGYEYDVGVNLAEFLCYNHKDIDKEYMSLIDYLIETSCERKVSILNVDDDICDFSRTLDEHSVYFHFYTVSVMRFFINYRKDPYLAFKELFKITKEYENEKEFWKLDSKKLYDGVKEGLVGERSNFDNVFLTSGPYNGIRMACEFAVKIIIVDLLYKREKIKKELEFLLSEQDELVNYDPLFKLFFLDMMRVKEGKQPYYTYNTFKIKYELSLKENYLFETLPDAYKYIQEKGIEMVEKYQLDEIDDLIKFEFINVIKENMKIKKCKYCNQFFFPKGRVDTEYCDRIIHGESKKCSEIGAVKLYQKQRENDPIYQIFHKVYKRMSSRVQQGKLSKKEFYSWSEEARNKRDMCSNGSLSFEDFENWLNTSK